MANNNFQIDPLEDQRIIDQYGETNIPSSAMEGADAAADKALLSGITAIGLQSVISKFLTPQQKSDYLANKRSQFAQYDDIQNRLPDHWYDRAATDTGSVVGNLGDPITFAVGAVTGNFNSGLADKAISQFGLGRIFALTTKVAIEGGLTNEIAQKPNELARLFEPKDIAVGDEYSYLNLMNDSVNDFVNGAAFDAGGRALIWGIKGGLGLAKHKLTDLHDEGVKILDSQKMREAAQKATEQANNNQVIRIEPEVQEAFNSARGSNIDPPSERFNENVQKIQPKLDEIDSELATKDIKGFEEFPEETRPLAEDAKNFNSAEEFNAAKGIDDKTGFQNPFVEGNPALGDLERLRKGEPLAKGKTEQSVREVADRHEMRQVLKNKPSHITSSVPVEDAKAFAEENKLPFKQINEKNVALGRSEDEFNELLKAKTPEEKKLAQGHKKLLKPGKSKDFFERAQKIGKNLDDLNDLIAERNNLQDLLDNNKVAREITSTPPNPLYPADEQVAIKNSANIPENDIFIDNSDNLEKELDGLPEEINTEIPDTVRDRFDEAVKNKELTDEQLQGLNDIEERIKAQPNIRRLLQTISKCVGGSLA